MLLLTCTTVGKSKSHSRKSSQSGSGNNNGPPSKKLKSSAKDVLAEAGKHGNYTEMALFDKVSSIDYIELVSCPHYVKRDCDGQQYTFPGPMSFQSDMWDSTSHGGHYFQDSWTVFSTEFSSYNVCMEASKY